VVMSPKSLLRHKLAVSKVLDFTDDTFHPVLDDAGVADPRRVESLLVVSGKFYYTLLDARGKRGAPGTAIVRLEQLYPFPHADYKAALAGFPQATEIVWCQEEPQNQGAWYRLRAYFRADALPKQVVAYAGRPVAAATAVGYMSKHLERQQKLVADAFAPDLSEGEMLVGT